MSFSRGEACVQLCTESRAGELFESQESYDDALHAYQAINTPLLAFAKSFGT